MLYASDALIWRGQSPHTNALPLPVAHSASSLHLPLKRRADLRASERSLPAVQHGSDALNELVHAGGCIRIQLMLLRGALGNLARRERLVRITQCLQNFTAKGAPAEIFGRPPLESWQNEFWRRCVAFAP